MNVATRGIRKGGQIKGSHGIKGHTGGGKGGRGVWWDDPAQYTACREPRDGARQVARLKVARIWRGADAYVGYGAARWLEEKWASTLTDGQVKLILDGQVDYTCPKGDYEWLAYRLSVEELLIT